MFNDIKYLKNNRCRKFQSLTDIDKGSSVLKDCFRHMLKHTNVLQAEWYYFLAVCIYSLNTKCLAKTFFDCFCKEKIREVVVDIVRHLFSRRRTIAYQLFAKKLFGE